ncbi:branched-chain amino acid ABC transporter permease [Mesorhizobium sp. YC-39]|uniref:branched-chain amino acid ABC transporter permease n=1 Tax=unclassified Mesorhizobium TaxID=325217 RepID=UPI0021E96E40|nr:MULTISPECIES: branched-chain amino acid ABC transporter permease [unclassified Mesorhizobium]MCV3211010.1 branched-chain amino acid ABC transporter permease [Mesorhizobium sp. YC-2]MCV3232735.1 branched-chain amino acid ABC transporter permease [Mesorhizobium sp. YC-39]
MDELQIYLVSALVSAAIWTLPAAAISLIYGVLRYPNFAIPEFMTLGAYLALLLCGFSVPLWLSALLAAVLTGLIALAVDQTIFRFVRAAGTLPPVLLSLGLMLFLQNGVRFIWGNDVHQYPIELARPFVFAGFIVTPTQAAMIGAVAVILVFGIAALRWTSFGRAVRATSTNPELAVVTGIRPEVVYGGIIFASGFLAAIGGVALATETSLTPLLGWRVLIPLFAVAILGGLGSATGAALAALLLATVSEFSLLLLPVTYKTALAFLVLALVLLVRPTGLIRTGGIER